MKHIQIINCKGSLYIDEAPSLHDLQKGSFDLIWNLAEELVYFADVEEKYAKSVLCARIKDFGFPKDKSNFSQQLNIVKDSLLEGKKVLIHCLGGKGRTGLALGCLLKSMTGLSYHNILQTTKEYCGGPETMEQIDFIREF